MITWVFYLVVAFLAIMAYLVGQVGQHKPLWAIGFWVVVVAGTIVLVSLKKK